MRLCAWNETGLNVDADDIAASFEPFVARQIGAVDEGWSQDIRDRKRKILKRYLRQRLIGWLPRHQRRAESIIPEYEKVWSAGHEKYRLGPPPRWSPWTWRGRCYYASSLGATRFRHAILAAVVERLKPRDVLEVGCGDGINLILLACRFPEVRFTGIELTPQGHRAAIEFQRNMARLPQALRDYAPLPLADPTAFRRIRFEQGDAANLPFADNAFGLVLTVLALEQMERIRHRALSEIARLACGHVFMIEPFRDVNDRGWPRLNAARRDYLRARVRDLANYGLEPEFAVDDYPQELFLRTCAVLARKRKRVSGLGLIGASDGTQSVTQACRAQEVWRGPRRCMSLRE